MSVASISATEPYPALDRYTAKECISECVCVFKCVCERERERERACVSMCVVYAQVFEYM